MMFLDDGYIGAVVEIPVITLDLAAATTPDDGTPFTLDATATGADTWALYLDGVITGTTGSGGTATFTSGNAFEGGAYDGDAYKFRFTNGGGFVDTTETTVAVNPASTLIVDNFNRSDNADPSVSQPAGFTWEEYYASGVPLTPYAIASNKLDHTTTDFTTLVNTTGLSSADHWSEVYVPTGVTAGTKAMGPAVRLNADATEGWIASVWSDRIRIYRIGSSALNIETDLGTGTNYSAKTIRLKAEGSTFTVYADAVSVGTWTSTTYNTNTMVGVNGRDLTGMDDFQADIV